MSDDKTFDIPVAVFIFKRLDTLERIFDRLAEVRPSKLYLIADQGRDEAERLAVDKVRRGVDSLITWDCEVVRDYAKENRGGIRKHRTWREASIRAGACCHFLGGRQSTFFVILPVLCRNASALS